LLHTQEVTGSNPVLPTMVAVLSEDLPLKELLLLILGEDGKRKVLLRTKSNEELFELYKAELALRVRNQRNLSLYRQLLDRFHDFLGKYPPSALLAKNFLTRFSSRKAATLYKYTSVIKGFMHWYGEDLEPKIKLPHQLPPYVEDDEINKLIQAIRDKQTHKASISGDVFLVEFAYRSGLRREELANLRVGDVIAEQRAIIVRHGKGDKDRTVPLPLSIYNKLAAYIENKSSDEKVFGISKVAISNKIRRLAKRAGVEIHAHSLRHAYATRLLEKGANIKVVQQLLGHSRIDTTERYLSLRPEHLRVAVDSLDEPGQELELRTVKFDQRKPEEIQFDNRYRYFLGSQKAGPGLK